MTNRNLLLTGAGLLVAIALAKNSTGIANWLQLSTEEKAESLTKIITRYFPVEDSQRQRIYTVALSIVQGLDKARAEGGRFNRELADRFGPDLQAILRKSEPKPEPTQN